MSISLPDRSSLRPGENFQDQVTSYLCSRALIALNRRHLAQRRRGQVRQLQLTSRDLRVLARWLMLAADAEFEAQYSDTHSTDPGMAKRYRLSRDKLEDGALKRATWIISHWDSRKVEGRSRGGSHGARNGVRKGRVGFPDFWAVAYEELPKKERKARIMTESGMSASTYYKLQRRAPEIRAAIEKRKAEQAGNRLDFDFLLEGFHSYEEWRKRRERSPQADSDR